jgi:hypothetical protein
VLLLGLVGRFFNGATQLLDVLAESGHRVAR